jgi:hypothetical protein
MKTKMVIILGFVLMNIVTLVACSENGVNINNTS